MNYSKKNNFFEILNNEGKNFDMIIVTDSGGVIKLYNNVLSQLCNSANKDEILLQEINLNQLFKSDEQTINDIINELHKSNIIEGKLDFALSYNQRIPLDYKAYKISEDLESQFNFIFIFKFSEISDIERDPLEQEPFLRRLNKSDEITNNDYSVLSLDELERLKEDFLSNVSHELRTPLASIIGFTETLKSDPNLPKDILLEFLDIILNEGKRLAATINDLLDVSQLYKGQLTLQKKVIEIQSILKGVYERYKPLANNINLAISLPEKPCFILADDSKFTQAIGNLVSNALKFTPEGGSIDIILKSSNKYFTIEIKDTGLGIPKNEIDKIFDKFYKINRPGLETRGVGLGLAITKKIIEQHNFQIEVESEENKGSIFRIIIPNKS